MAKLSTREKLNIKNETRNHNLFLIQGVAGSGKSLLLKDLSADNGNNCSSNEDSPIPISLSATDFFEKYSCNIEMVYKSLSSKSCLKEKEFDNAAIDFYIDGLDELTDSNHRKSLLQSIKRHHRSEKIRFFITSRIIEEINPSSPEINHFFKTIHIAGLTSGEKRDMVTNNLKSLISREDMQFLLEQISENPMVDSLIGTPGFLSNVCEEYKGALQQRKHETILRGRDSEAFSISRLYRESVRYILEEKEIVRGDKNRFRGLVKHVALLYDIAAAMFLSCEEDDAEISGTEFDRIVEKYCEEHGIDNQYMKREIQDSNLLYLTDNNTGYRFIQPYFEGYFLAEYLYSGKKIDKRCNLFEECSDPSVFTEGELFIFSLRESDPARFNGMRCQVMMRFYLNMLDSAHAERFLLRVAHLIPVNIQMEYNPCDKICGNLFDTFDNINFILALDLMKYAEYEIDDNPFILFIEKKLRHKSCPESLKQSFLIKVRQHNPSLFSKAVARTLWMHEENMQLHLSRDMQQLFYEKNWPSDLLSFFNPQLEPWLIQNSFNLTPQSFMARWRQIKTEHEKMMKHEAENLSDSCTVNLIDSAVERREESRKRRYDVEEEQYNFYKETRDIIREIIGDEKEPGKLRFLENSGLPCREIRAVFEELNIFLTDLFEKSVGFWFVEHYRQIKKFRQAMENESDHLKRRLIRDTFLNDHFELKQFKLSIGTPPLNGQKQKDIQQRIDEFITMEIGLPQGDLSLEITESGAIQTDYICLRKTGKIAAVFTGWPHREEGTGEIIFYTYLCAGHPELPGLGLGTRLHEHFFDENERREAKGESFYKKFIGAVNPFGIEAYFHIHKLGAICKVMIERNRYIAEKFPYYGGVKPHRFIAEFSRENHKLAIERSGQAASLDSYTPKAYNPPTKENMIYPSEDLSHFYTKVESLRDNETILLKISVIKEKFNRLNMTDHEKQEVERESSIFYEHCLILFKNGYQIVDCYRKNGEGVNQLGYIFTKLRCKDQ